MTDNLNLSIGTRQVQRGKGWVSDYVRVSFPLTFNTLNKVLSSVREAWCISENLRLPDNLNLSISTGQVRRGKVRSVIT